MLKNKGKYIPHIRIPISLFEHPSYLCLPERKKALCLAVFMILMRFADSNTGRCYPRLSLIAKILGLSRTTVYRCICLLIQSNIVAKKRLPSTNLYTINKAFMVKYLSDVSNSNMDVSNRNMDVSNSNVLIELSYNNYLNRTKLGLNNKIDRLINIHKGNKDSLLKSLNGLSLHDFNSLSKTHPYYYKLALEFRKDLDHELKAKQVDVSKTLERVRKFSNSNYRNKINYNKRNNIKPGK